MATNRTGQTPAKTRTNKTPAQRAIEAYDTAARVTKRLADKLDALKAELAPVETELEAAKRRLAYLAANPDLPEGHVKTETSGPSGDADTSGKDDA